MRSTLIPGTDLRVSRLALGCWALGGQGWGDDVDDASSEGAVRAALEAGITLFDTAPIYGLGHADRLLRRALGERIHDVTIATKAGPRGEPPICDLSPENLRRDVEESRQRLGKDRLDLLQVHWPCEVGTPLAATIEALQALQDEDKIGAFGLCNYEPEALDEACRLGAVRTLQTPLSFVRREYEAGLSEVAARHGIGVLAYEPLARGLLTGKYRRLPRFAEDDIRRRDSRFWAMGFARLAPRVERLRRVADKLGTTPAALAIAWAATRPAVTSVLFGAKRAAQVEENVRAAELLDDPRLGRV